MATKKEIVQGIIADYELNNNREVGVNVRENIVKRMTNLSVERLEKYQEYIANGKDRKRDAAFCIALATGVQLKIEEA